MESACTGGLIVMVQYHHALHLRIITSLDTINYIYEKENLNTFFDI